VLQTTAILRPARGEFRQALSFLDERYPQGLDWLEAKLDQVELGRAEAWGLSQGRTLLGHALLSPKGAHATKLCTFHIGLEHRGRGLGSVLLSALKRRWAHQQLDLVHVTVPEQDRQTRVFFERHGFLELEQGRRRYGKRFDLTYGYWPAAT
jgi:ribosomal protein S18 acetylase RimI-like enzyme